MSQAAGSTRCPAWAFLFGGGCGCGGGLLSWLGLGGDEGSAAGPLAWASLAVARRQDGSADSGVTAAGGGPGLPFVATGGGRPFGEGTAASPTVLAAWRGYPYSSDGGLVFIPFPLPLQ